MIESRKTYIREYMRGYRKDNPDLVKSYNDNFKANNPTYHLEWERNNKKRRRDKRNANPNTKDRGLKSKFGITTAMKFEMLEAQGGICRCCGSADPRSKNGWHVDHDPSSTKKTGIVIRGILCNTCNPGIGKLGDTKQSIQEFYDIFKIYLTTTAAHTEEFLKVRTRVGTGTGPRIGARGKDLRLRAEFKINLTDFYRLLEFQGNACAICKTTTPGTHGFCVDHDHKTKKIRGIVCNECNAKLSRAGDDLEAMDVKIGMYISYLTLPPMKIPQL